VFFEASVGLNLWFEHRAFLTQRSFHCYSNGV